MSASEMISFEQPTAEPPVRGFLHLPATPSGDGVVLTHGAGSNCEAPLLTAVATALCECGFIVLRCDLPFRQLQPHGPPPRGSAERDQEGLLRAVEALRGEALGDVYLGGHSYGGRQASMLAALRPGLVAGLLLLSYPVHPPTRPDVIRTAHFPELRAPALFVHGSRDPFASMEEITAALNLIPAATELVAVEGAGHDLLTGKNRRNLPRQIAESFRTLVGL
jgi:uncharacterized protein